MKTANNFQNHIHVYIYTKQYPIINQQTETLLYFIFYLKMNQYDSEL